MKLGKHQFKVGQQVNLPGAAFRNPGCKNRYMWNVAGTIEELGWSQPMNTGERIGWTERDTEGRRIAIYATEPVQHPIYKVNGKWYLREQLKKA